MYVKMMRYNKIIIFIEQFPKTFSEKFLYFFYLERKYPIYENNFHIAYVTKQTALGVQYYRNLYGHSLRKFHVNWLQVNEYTTVFQVYIYHLFFSEVKTA